MIWSQTARYELEPYEHEADLEKAIKKVALSLFGDTRLYLDIKKKIGGKGKPGNIPDGYLFDLSSHRNPVLYVVEVELSAHEPLRHIAVQVLQFSLSFEDEPHKVKQIVKDALDDDQAAKSKCERYAVAHGFENVDYLLERMIYGGGFNALVIIDELSDDLESALIRKFRFPVEVITLARYVDDQGNRLYQFDPFLAGVFPEGPTETSAAAAVDPSDIDTIVVPAREEGFQRTFLGQNRWYAIRMHSSFIPRIKWIAAYRVAPVSAITHVAAVDSIEQWEDTAKYVVNFAGRPEEIEPIGLVKKGRVKAPQSPRYTAHDRLLQGKTLDDVF